MAIDFKRVREIFDHAVEIDPAARSAFLSEHCGEDAALRTEVEELLLAHVQADSFMRQPARPSLSGSSAETLMEAQERRIGQYRILSELGRGGMGVVYLAERADGEFQKRVAIKVMRSGVDPRLIDRFRRERQILADLEHPNIARLIDGGSVDGLPYVVMEYVAGRSLRALLRDRGALPAAEAVEIAQQICAGLEAAHQRKIVHRDIKPENLMVCDSAPQLQVKILDFGISRLSETSDQRTETGLILGTAAYMSPEQAAGMSRDHIDARADIYSVGMVLYEMLTGATAFTGSSPLVQIHKHLHESPLPPSRRAPDRNLSPSLDAAVLKALEKDRERRPESVRQFAQDLSAALAPPVPADKGITLNALWAILIAIALSLAAYFLFRATQRAENAAQRRPNSASAKEASSIPSPRYQIFQHVAGGPVRPIESGKPLHRGDRIHFEFRLPFQGSFYLFYEKKDGSLIWANPRKDGSPQVGPAAGIVRVPELNEIRLGPGDGPQNFLAVYVPADSDWSLQKMAFPESILLQQGPEFVDARLSRSLSSKLRQALEEKGSLVQAYVQGTEPATAQVPVDPSGRAIRFHTLSFYQAP